MTIANGILSYAGVSLPVWNRAAASWVGRQVALEEYVPLDDVHLHGHELSHLHLPTFDQPPAAIGTLRWPQGASRWAVGHFVVTESKLDTIRAAVGAGNDPQTLVLSDRVSGHTLTAAMYLLPPRPLLVGEPATDDGPLWVMTLVDERYFWWRKLATLDPVPGSWEGLFDELATALGVTLVGADQVPAAYGAPTDRYRVADVPAPLVLDSAAGAVGLRVVRDPDGTVTLQPWDAAHAAHAANHATYTAASVSGVGRVMGGGRVASADVARSVPGRLRVVFGRTVDGAVASGGYALTRTLSAMTHEPSEYTLSAYYGLNASGMLAHAGRFTADAYAAYTGTALTNASALTALADRAAYDWYGWHLGRVDAQFPGVLPWDGDAFADQVVWTYDEERVTTRVRRAPYFDANVYGTHGAAPAGGSGGDGGFWAALTTKSGTTCPAYTFVEVEEDGEPTAWAAVSGGRTGTAHEVNCVDLPAADLADEAIVVRVYQDADGDYYFETPPRWEFVRPTGAVSGGFYPGVLTHFPSGGSPTDGDAILILDLNGL